MDLWHYTCDHGLQGIKASGWVVIPAAAQLGSLQGTPGEFAWFTDLSHPLREGLGLTSTILACDRTEHRLRVLDSAPIVPWTKVRRSWGWAAELESAPGARPAHWYVAAEPVRVELAEARAA